MEPTPEFVWWLRRRMDEMDGKATPVVPVVSSEPRRQSVAEAIRAAKCPRCRAAPTKKCRTPTGRSHSERVREALRLELNDLALERGRPDLQIEAP